MSIYESTQYLEQNRTWHVEDSPWKARQVLTLLERNHVQFRTMCDVGCGAGEVLVQLHKAWPQTAEFVGYDVSPQVESMWKERAKEGILFRREDFLQRQERYDVLLCIDVIEHIEDYLGFLRKIRDRAQYKVFNFPLEISALKAAFAGKFVESRKRYGHLHFFNRDLCLAVLEDLGYEVADSMYAGGAIELSSTSTSISLASRMLKVPRMLLSAISTDLTAKLLGGYSLFVMAK
jgi:predicted TPR repeat methyltransferase